MAEHQSAACATGRPMPDPGHFAGIPLERRPHKPTEKERAHSGAGFDLATNWVLRAQRAKRFPWPVLRVATQRNSGARAMNALISLVRPFQKNRAIRGPTTIRAITLGEKPE